MSDAICHILKLPNEILLAALSPFPATSLLRIAPTCHRIYALVLRILYSRLDFTDTLVDHTLLLECYHPSVKLTEPPLFCTYMETPGLGDELSNIDSIGPSKVAGNIEKMRSLYSIFRPHRSQKERRTNRHPAGDVPGSRTHPSSTQNNVYFSDDKEVAHQLLTLDGSELFTQLCSVVNLVKLGPRHGIFQCIVEVDESVVRVYRDWLADMASSQGFTKNRSKFRDEASSQFPLVDPEDKNIVWAGSKKNIGLRFKITERTIRRDKPVLMYADEDSTVTYDIEYEELLVRTFHLSMMLEQSYEQSQNASASAVVFASMV